MSDTPPVIRRGDSGPWVKIWQEHGLYPRGLLALDGVDAVYGPATEAATREYQSRAGLKVDGVVGSWTWGYAGWTPEVGILRGAPRRQSVRRLVIHHTVTRSVHATIDVLRARGLSTHYIVGPAGDVHKTLDPRRYRARHAAGHNEDTIGIDVVSPLDIALDGRGQWKTIREAPWAPARDGHRYWADTDAAVLATWELVARLGREYGVPVRWPVEWGTLRTEATSRTGIYAHGHLSNTRWDGYAILNAWDVAGWPQEG